MKVKIKRLDPSALLPQYHTGDSAGFDIASNADIVIKSGEVAKIPTGLVIAAPSGHFLLIAARSSLPLKKGLVMANGIGIIDPDFAGPNDEIHLIVQNITKQEVAVKKGERLAQGVFIRTEQAEWLESDELLTEDRGGMGSTGGYHQTDNE